jgi:hypothetical protein
MVTQQRESPRPDGVDGMAAQAVTKAHPFPLAHVEGTNEKFPT